MEEALIKRILPHSIEAEQSVIGSMILDRDAILVASEILTSDDFYQKQYGIIFDAMVELCNEGKPVDLVTLQNRLKEKELPPDISSMEYVRELIEAVPTSANVKYYANIVSEKALLRRLIKATEDVANTTQRSSVRKQSFADLSRQMKRLPTPAIWRRRIQRLFWKKQKKNCSIFSRDATMKNMFQSSR